MCESDDGTAGSATNDELSTGGDQRGPWLLALGVLAFLVTGARWLVDRLRRRKAGRESSHATSDRSRR